jgi:serine-type D-Ala-D-Ala carboxypeptidase/endopeptidase
MALAGGCSTTPETESIRTMLKQPDDDGAIRDILRRRVEVEKRTVGIAVAVVSGRTHRVTCYGRERLGNEQKVAANTLFEIGSITKVYTALLLADLAREGVLAIDDPAAKHLPADFFLPERDGRPITLADLATHTAGLPRTPPMGRPFEEFASFDEFVEQLVEATKSYSLVDLKGWLRDFKLPRTPGSAWEYSNVGYALLGLALSHRTDLSYEELLTRRIINPLGLTGTHLRPPAAEASHLAEGHDTKLNPVPPYDGGIFAPAGDLRASVEDLARFVQAVMPGSSSSIEPSARLLLQTIRPAPAAGGQQALGWEVLSANEGDYISKDGVTPGQCATAVFDPAGRRGVVALSNTFPMFQKTDTSPSGGGTGAGDVARHLLRPSIPLGT